jgi:hypothetical protein
MNHVWQWRRAAFVALVCCTVLSLAWSLARAEVAATATAPAAKLVIKKAVYGDLPDGKAIDVTEKVAVMVKEGALSVDATNENFTDPAEGIAKKLKVDYTFDGAAKSKTVDEGQTLTISDKGE